MTRKYEELGRSKNPRNVEKYWELKAEYENRGLAVIDGGYIELTDWANQNDVLLKGKYKKVRNARDGRCVVVLKDGNKQPEYLWAGFIKDISPKKCK